MVFGTILCGIVGYTLANNLLNDKINLNTSIIIGGSMNNMLIRARELKNGNRFHVLLNKLKIFFKKITHDNDCRDTLLNKFVELLDLDIPNVEFTEELKKVYDSFNLNVDIKSNGRAFSRIDDIVQLIDSIDLSDKNILDVGCADGSILRTLKNHFNLSSEQCYGVDITDLETDEFIFNKIQNNKIPLESKSMDIITVLMAAHHFTNLDAMLKEIKRVLKDDGIVIIREHDVDSSWDVDPVFIDIVHLVYACIVNNEQTIEEFFNEYYSNYKTKKDWSMTFKKYRFKQTGFLMKKDLYRSFYMKFNK
jgi:ubiquinone/menaquinone biosynthesis C-methylase UbiE